MNIIVKQGNFFVRLLGEQSYKPQLEYRKIKYHKTMPVDDGFLVYNTFTGELLLLDEYETSVFEGKIKDDEVIETLVKKWLMVNLDNDDLKLSYQFAETAYLYNCSRVGSPQNTFVILPTTDCNARCFYCYELAGNRRNMTEQTAHDVADFIERKCGSKRSIHIRWFGGEPLYNRMAIDVICADLRKKGIKYSCAMVSNGYLFDEQMVKDAANDWKLDTIQITLDGTEEIYNRIKAYIYKGVNAFERVIDNIKLLLEAGIAVNIRLNMDDHNEKDLFKLTEFLIEKFKDYNNLNIYPHLLFEDSCARISAREDNARHELIDMQIKLKEYILDNQKLSRSMLTPQKKVNHCMADSDATAMILPDGKLGKCQHFTDDHYYGSIYSDEIDVEVVNSFKKMGVVDPERCDGCELHPYCMCLASCLIVPRRCDDYDKKIRVEDLETKILNAYKLYKAKEKKQNETQV